VACDGDRICWEIRTVIRLIRHPTPHNTTGQRALEEASELLEQMEVDVADLPAEDKASAKKRLQSYKQQLSEASSKLKRSALAVGGGQAARSELFGYDATSDDSKAALISNTERLDRTSARLQDGHRTAVETIAVGAGIMENLHSQRQQIEAGRGRVSGGVGRCAS
jgi:vesicle transport through interaction with t-SNAREs protein 1